MWSDEVALSASGMAFRRFGSGRPVVLVHGIPGSGACWRAVAEHLPDGLDVVVPDLLGFARSLRPRRLEHLHAAAQAEALGALLTELGLGPAVVVGHDFGGPVALALAGSRPEAVASLGLLAANTFGDTPIPFPLSSVTWPLVGRLAARLLFSGPGLALMLRQGVRTAGTVLDQAAYLGDRGQRASTATLFAGSLRHLAELYRPVERQLRACAVPALVGWGDADPFFPISQGKRTARAAGGLLSVYAGAGHFLPAERPAEVAADIAALAGRARPRRSPGRRPSTCLVDEPG